MALLALASNRGSPGCTTTALALAAAWPLARGAPLLVEADPDGGVLAARCGLGIKPGLIELCGRARVALTDDDVWSFAQELPCGVPVLVGHPAAEPCHAALRSAGAQLADYLAAMPERDAIVDVGRLQARLGGGLVLGRDGPRAATPSHGRGDRRGHAPRRYLARLRRRARADR